MPSGTLRQRRIVNRITPSATIFDTTGKTEPLATRGAAGASNRGASCGEPTSYGAEARQIHHSAFFSSNTPWCAGLQWAIESWPSCEITSATDVRC